jgi:hypothetical protein
VAALDRHDGRPEVDAVDLPGHHGEHGQRVERGRLREPDGVEAEVGGEAGPIDRRRHRRHVAAREEPDLHGRACCSFVAPAAKSTHVAGTPVPA